MVNVAVLEPLLLGALALAILVKSAQTAVGALIRLAKHYDVPDVVVGVTIVAVGTSLPEIGSHVIASLGIISGALDYTVTSATVLGGNMGSSVTQQLLLFGIFLVGFGRYRPRQVFLTSTFVPMVLAAVLVLAVAFDGTISRVDGLVLLGAYVAHTYYAVTHRERGGVPPEPESKRVGRDAFIALLGLVGVIVGAYIVLATVETIVARLRLGGSMVGLVTIGLASALPELSTVFEGLRRRAPDIAVGTLVGSNIVNPLLAIGLGGVISTYQVPEAVVVWDLPVKILAGVVVLGWVWTLGKGSLGRKEGFYMVVAYFTFVSGRLLLFAGQ
ncbi:sodium:calcium antiporter [Haloarchaeobius sp. TZWSO28]|uniref:sodium:calcium antiporter n=1 Tax=Haloarchaeobius sp. TZWSO28 TaxID=3446119 RepID=UPI003EB9DFC5